MGQPRLRKLTASHSIARYLPACLMLLLLLSLACALPGRPAEPPPMPTETPPESYPIESPTPPDSLNSYRTTVVLDFAGTAKGQAVGGQIESLTEVNPPARHRYLNIQATRRSGVWELFQVGDKIYLKKPDEPAWLFLTGSPPQLNTLEPEQFIIIPAAVTEPPRLENLNGQSVRHYTFTEADLNRFNLSFSRARGDLWLTNQNNYLAQYVLSATVRIVLPDPQISIFEEGELQLRYTLTDRNADFAITPPSMPTGLADIPRLPEAEPISALPGLVEYISPTSPISATLFYRDQLAAAGWEEQANTAIFNDKARLLFSRREQKLTIIITPAEATSGSKVMISLE